MDEQLEFIHMLKGGGHKYIRRCGMPIGMCIDVMWEDVRVRGVGKEI